MTAAPLIQRAKFCCYYKLTPCTATIAEQTCGICEQASPSGKAPSFLTVEVSSDLQWADCATYLAACGSAIDWTGLNSPNGTYEVNHESCINAVTYLSAAAIAFGSYDASTTGNCGSLDQNYACVAGLVVNYFNLTSPDRMLIQCWLSVSRISGGVTVARAFSVTKTTAGIVDCFAVHELSGTMSVGCGFNGVRMTGDVAVTIRPGTVVQNTRCPGGDPFIVSNPEFGALVGRVVTVGDVCYQVARATPAEFCAAEVIFELEEDAMDTLTDCGTSCPDCCDDDCP